MILLIWAILGGGDLVDLDIYRNLGRSRVAAIAEQTYILEGMPPRQQILQFPGREVVARPGEGPGDLRLAFGIIRVGDRLAVIENMDIKWFDATGQYLERTRLTFPNPDPMVEPWRIERTVDGWVGHLFPSSRDRTIEVHWVGDDGTKKKLASFPWPHFREDHQPRDNNPIKNYPGIDVSLDRTTGVVLVPETNRVIYLDLVKRSAKELTLAVPRIPVDQSAFAESLGQMRTRFRAKTGETMNHDLPEYLPPIDQAAIGLNGEIVVQIGHFAQGTKTLAFDIQGNPVEPTISTNDLSRIITCQSDRCLLSFMVDGEAELRWAPRNEVVATLKANPLER